MIMICTDCKSDRIVWNWTDGDIVCTSCGLVQQERFIDDRVPFKDYCDYEIERIPLNKTVQKHTDSIYGLSDDIVTATNAWCVETRCVERQERVKKEDVAAGVHANMKGVSVRSICNKMNISQSKFWKAVSKKKESESDCGAMMKRLVYESEYIPKKRSWDVIKVGNKILDVIKGSKHIQTLKPDKLALSLIIISCEINKLGKKRSFACKDYGISVDTVRKHERLIQDLLSKQQKNLRA